MTHQRQALELSVVGSTVLILTACGGAPAASQTDDLPEASQTRTAVPDSGSQTTTVQKTAISTPTDRAGAKTPEESSSGITAVPEMTFINEAFGFHITLPETWRGFQTIQHDQERVTSICFWFADLSPICVLQIDVFTKASWERLEKIPSDYYIAETDLYVFAAGPFTSECVQLDAFQCDRYHEVPGILASFELQ